MRTAVSRFFLAAAVVVGGLVPSSALRAQTPSLPAWDVKLGFNHLATNGNTETSSSGFDLALNRSWRAWALEGSAAGVSATKRKKRTAENYLAQARAKRRLFKRLQLTFGLRWERNRFAGLDFRQGSDVSVLWEIHETPTWKMRALAGVSFSREDPRGDRPQTDAFGGLLQLSGDARLSETASWDGQVTFFPNFDDPEDYRFHGSLGLQAALNRHLGVRLGYDFKLDNEPVAGFSTTDTATTAALVLQLGKKAKP